MKSDTDTPPKKHLLLGITGGIAAYKIPLLIRLLTKSNYAVKVVLTEAAKPLVGEETLRTLSAHPVFSDSCSSVHDMNHIRLAEWADYFIICPATANTLAKLAHGLADNLLTTLALAFKGRLIVAPAMNTYMWHNPATCSNIDILKQRGVRVLPVGSGDLACGDQGAGRMLAVEDLAEYLLGADLPGYFANKKILIASGPTAEPIDPVRVITNRSTGRMGRALAYAAMCMDAQITVVSGLEENLFPENSTIIHASRSIDMATALKKHFLQNDVCIMAAAISDFIPAHVSAHKISRNDQANVTLDLKPNQDISQQLSQLKKQQFLVCFALETKGNEKRAQEKMQKKGCDMMIYNEVASSLGTESSQITIMSPNEDLIRTKAMSKRECAQVILYHVAQKMGLTHG